MYWASLVAQTVKRLPAMRETRVRFLGQEDTLEKEKAGLKLNIQNMKIMISGPITSWQIDEETMERLREFIFLGSKISSDRDCSHKIKKYLLLGRKAMTKLDSILKRRDITLLTKLHLVKAMVFPAVTHVCESWTIKKN